MAYLSLPYLALYGFFAALPVIFFALFFTHTPIDLFFGWSFIMALILLTVDSRAKARQQSGFSKTLQQVCEFQETVFQKLTQIEEHQSKENEADDLISEIRILKELVQNAVDQEFSKSNETDSSSSVSVHVIPQGQETIESDGTQGTEIHELTRERLLEIIKGALQNDRIEMLLQPIVSLPQRKLRAFECYSRLRDADGTIIVPDHYLGVAHENDLMHIIDNTLLFRCVQLIRKAIKKKITVPFFCNLSLSTLKDRLFLDSFLEFISHNKSLAPTIVFELECREFLNASQEARSVLEKLASYGCRFSLDHIEKLEQINFEHLNRHNVKYLKLDVTVLLANLQKDPEGKAILSFKKQADKQGLDIILTKIEDEKELVELLDFQFDFGQGYLFGKPRLSQRW